MQPDDQQPTGDQNLPPNPQAGGQPPIPPIAPSPPVPQPPQPPVPPSPPLTPAPQAPLQADGYQPAAIPAKGPIIKKVLIIVAALVIVGILSVLAFKLFAGGGSRFSDLAPRTHEGLSVLVPKDWAPGDESFGTMVYADDRDADTMAGFISVTKSIDLFGYEEADSSTKDKFKKDFAERMDEIDIGKSIFFADSSDEVTIGEFSEVEHSFADIAAVAEVTTPRDIMFSSADNNDQLMLKLAILVFPTGANYTLIVGSIESEWPVNQTPISSIIDGAKLAD